MPVPSVLMVGNFLSPRKSARDFSEDLSERLRCAGWNTITVSEKLPPLQRVADMLSTVWLRRHDYRVAHVDVYSSRAFMWAEAASLLLKRLRKPHILTLRGGGLPAFARLHPRRVRRLLQSADIVTCPSPFLLERMREYRPDLKLLPNAVPIERYRFKDMERTPPRLMWLRGFHRYYNPLLPVRVAACLASEFPDLSLTMVGPVAEREQYRATRQAAIDLGVADRVEMPGGVPKLDVPQWLSRGNIFLNTPNVDNTPVSVLEAMATGLCVVSTNVGGIPYMLEHEETALLVPPDDPQAMADAVRRIVHEPALASRLALQGRTCVESFDWSSILPRWRELLSSIAV